MHRNRRIAVLAACAALMLLAARHPSFDLHIDLHRMGDPDPRSIETALDLGGMAMNLGITWTHGQLR